MGKVLCLLGNGNILKASRPLGNLQGRINDPVSRAQGARKFWGRLQGKTG